MEDSILTNLCSKAKLDRDKGYQQILEYLGSSNVEDAMVLERKLMELVSDSTCEWETKHGSLMGLKAFCQTNLISDDISVAWLSEALLLADDNEFRVRIAAGELIGAMCKRYGSHLYQTCKKTVLDGISTNLEREPMSDSSVSEQEDAEKLMEKLSSSPRGEKRLSTDSSQIFHDTAGWKSLETWMKCLQNIIEGCAHLFNDYVDQELLDLIFRCLTHTNRFVRETGYYVCSSLVACGAIQEGSEGMLLDEENAILKYGHQFCEYLAKGLADNWSQVRLASSVATRRFLQSLPSLEARQQFYPLLLPRMCLNRYYVAEGVKIYSQETWKQVTGSNGKQLVETYIENVVDYYVEATEADNHAVREAACACIAELGAKVSKEVMASYIPKLLDALIVCFNDDSWPVRDAACVACGNFILCFPDESRSLLPTLYTLFFNNLQDNIPSVRQGAALALSNVVKAYGEECFEEILTKVKEGLNGIENQPKTTERYSTLEKGPATYGVVKKLRDNDMELHSDKQMYSCGSLAPKMGRGGGCMDHKFRKEPEPWELCDGCIHVVAELSGLQNFSQKTAELLPLVAKAAARDHYTHHINMKETVCQRLPHIANNLGKKYFKMYLELFFDTIFLSLTDDNALASAAANNCLAELSKFLGPSILKGRIEQYNPRYLELLPHDLGAPASNFPSHHMMAPVGPGLAGPRAFSDNGFDVLPRGGSPWPKRP